MEEKRRKLTYNIFLKHTYERERERKKERKKSYTKPFSSWTKIVSFIWKYEVGMEALKSKWKEKGR